jgi:sirohydrochlorin cobaltochelatase
MIRTALVLAAHGSRCESAVNTQIRAYADAIVELTLFDEVAVAFHQGDPSFSIILDQLIADDVTVVPVMTSVGYYSDMVLPRELSRNRRYADVMLRLTTPLGTHASLIDIMADRVRRLYARFDLASDQTSLAVIGHGTSRHAQSRNTTRDLAAWLRRMRIADEVTAAFLDDDPPVDSLLERVHHASVVVAPFLIGIGPHAVGDIPRRVGLAVSENVTPPFSGRVGDRLVVCDAPIGADPCIVDLIVELAFSASVCVNDGDRGTASPAEAWL